MSDDKFPHRKALLNHMVPLGKTRWFLLKIHDQEKALQHLCFNPSPERIAEQGFECEAFSTVDSIATELEMLKELEEFLGEQRRRLDRMTFTEEDFYEDDMRRTGEEVSESIEGN